MSESVAGTVPDTPPSVFVAVRTVYVLVTVRVFPALSVAVTVNERVPGVLVSIPAAWHEATPEVASVHVHDGLAG